MKCHAVRWRASPDLPVSHELTETVPFRSLKAAREWARGLLSEPIFGTVYSMSRERSRADYIEIISARGTETVERACHYVPSVGERGFW